MCSRERIREKVHPRRIDIVYERDISICKEGHLDM